MQRIAINGFGRIGRNVLRAWFESPKQFQFDIVAINDIADVQTLVHLFKYDTTHGRFAGQVEIQIENEQIFLNIQSHQRQLKLQVFKQAQPELLLWADLKIDVVWNVQVYFVHVLMQQGISSRCKARDYWCCTF
jgi:glyceraldehyde-3-phosphate dehydrogenase/erythrose-4-phosphate dehydrogenase